MVVDVWSRTGPKYRFRAVALLLLNLLLFSGLCVFMHWLHVARLFEFTWESYAAPLKFWGQQTQNLNDFVLYPISVEQNPMHGVVLGLLVASIVAIPISVSILYRFPYALPFIAAVFIFAHMPWMAITLVACCLLAAVRPFRLSFRFGAALVGMLPVILYLYLATRGLPHQLGTYASPDQKLLLAAPWVLAILAACAMLAVILTISRLVNYRPGAVAPVMAVMFATPAIIFHRHVGFDEVAYRVLEAEHGPRSQRVQTRLRERLDDMFTVPLDEPTRNQVFDIIFGRPEARVALQQRVIRGLLKELLTERRRGYEACRNFISDHPGSRYVPAALYIQARILDTRLNERRMLPPSGPPPTPELYSDFPHVQSEEAWLPLLNRYSDSPLAIAARLRLAQLRLRQGQLPAALELLAALCGPAAEHPQTQASTRPAERSRPSVDSVERSLGFEPEPHLREAERLYELVLTNHDDPKYGAVPLYELAALDPNRPGYRNQLLHLAERYRDGLLYDNLIVLWAAAEPDRTERAAKLAACLEMFPEGRAAAEAMFRLAELDMQARGPDQDARRQRGLALMRRLVDQYSHTHWGAQAERHLSLLAPPTELAADRSGSP